MLFLSRKIPCLCQCSDTDRYIDYIEVLAVKGAFLRSSRGQNLILVFAVVVCKQVSVWSRSETRITQTFLIYVSLNELSSFQEQVNWPCKKNSCKRCYDVHCLGMYNIRGRFVGQLFPVRKGKCQLQKDLLCGLSAEATCSHRILHNSQGFHFLTSYVKILGIAKIFQQRSFILQPNTASVHLCAFNFVCSSMASFPPIEFPLFLCAEARHCFSGCVFVLLVYFKKAAHKKNDFCKT